MRTSNAMECQIIVHLFGRDFVCWHERDGTSGTNSWDIFTVDDVTEDYADKLADCLNINSEIADCGLEAWFIGAVYQLCSDWPWPLLKISDDYHPDDMALAAAAEELLAANMKDDDLLQGLAEHFGKPETYCNHDIFGPFVEPAENIVIRTIEEMKNHRTCFEVSRLQESQNELFEVADPKCLEKISLSIKRA